MSQLFDKIKVGAPSRSTFDLSHNQVMTSDFGYLTPVCVRDMVPNDDFVITPNIFVRLMSLWAPVYGNIKIRLHHFFVPYRILYPDWDAFISQDKSNNTIPPYFLISTLRQALNVDPQFNTEPTTNLRRGIYGRLMANLGLNPELIMSTEGLASTDRISAFRFLAYYRIWLDWFMDSNIYDHSQEVRTFNSHIANGGSMAVYGQYLQTRNCCYKKDYFTTAKVNPQDGSSPSVVEVQVNPVFRPTGSNAQMYAYTDGDIGSGTSRKSSIVGQFSVEALRAANSLQRYLERNNFVGSKTINRLLAHFGIAPAPERLDMAEFIGGSSFSPAIGDVTSTSFSIDSHGQSSGNEGLGFMAGKGLGGRSMESVRYHAKEHGVFMSIMSILPDTAYYQGIDRNFQKGVFGDPLDFFHPEFENLGYQEILNKEVYVPTPSVQYDDYDPDGIFGFTPRYSEYKFQNDTLSGDFVGNPLPSFNNGSTPMDSWHLFRKLIYDQDDQLALNQNFVECDNQNNDYDRIFQYMSSRYDHFYFNIRFDVKATRPMSGFGEPSLDANNSAAGNSMNLPYGGTRL